MIPFLNTTPVDIGLGNILPKVGFTGISEEGPNPPLPTGLVEPAVPTALTLPP